ncbi:L-type lectin-domain containing receptor kinase IX.1, partial [Bienertia sinuspersici]
KVKSIKLPNNAFKNNKKKGSIILASAIVSIVGCLALLALVAIPFIRRRMIKKRDLIRRMQMLERRDREYLAELCTIGRLRHRNILQLRGWSHKNKLLLLVYDFMANGSLDEFITGQNLLDWNTRCKILIGLASALLYLHEECGDPIVHRDVKPNNVMLDEEFNPYLGDFGLARLLKNTTGVITKLVGTLGYMAPELIYTSKATTESDVYSFGVVALEVVSGMRFSYLVGDLCLDGLCIGHACKGFVGRVCGL